jgi:hypothetical protein
MVEVGVALLAPVVTVGVMEVDALRVGVYG